MSKTYVELDFTDAELLEFYDNYAKDTDDLDGLHASTTAILDAVYETVSSTVNSWPTNYIEELRMGRK